MTPPRLLPPGLPLGLLPDGSSTRPQREAWARFIAANIEARRCQLGMPESQLIKLAGVSGEAIKTMRDGHEPRAAVIERLAQALMVPAAQLTTGAAAPDARLTPGHLAAALTLIWQVQARFDADDDPYNLLVPEVIGLLLARLLPLVPLPDLDAALAVVWKLLAQRPSLGRRITSVDPE